jgi:twitching motility two-component system response regulator PilH
MPWPRHEVLKSRGWQGSRAACRREKPDVILLDVIRWVNGYQVCRQIKAAPETANIPVVMITSKPGQRPPLGYGAGRRRYIVKPFDPDDLLTIIDRLAPRTG